MIAHEGLDTSSLAISLLALQPGPREEEIVCTLKQSDLDHCAAYTVLACMQEEDNSQIHIQIDGADRLVSRKLGDALRHVRKREEALLLWVEELCHNAGHQRTTRDGVFPTKPFHLAAQRVLIWSGAESDQDFMNHYLGGDTKEATKHAFEFAHLLVTARTSKVAMLLKKTFPGTEKHSWVYLVRILYRPWYRGLPLLKTNYVEDLEHCTVQYGSLSIRWRVLHEAGRRLWTARPTPHFLLQSSTAEADRDAILLADHDWLQASLRFGWSSATMLARLHWLIKNNEGNMHGQRFMAHLGHCSGLYDMDSNIPLIRAYCGAVEAGNGDEVIAPAAFEAMKDVPTMPFEGFLSKSPVPHEQAPFVHTHVNRRKILQLVLLLPHNGLPASPVQCGLVDCALEDVPPFTFVLNASLRTPRSKACILVNGQAFYIPKILELFLRLIRDAEYGRFLFLWKICVYPEQVEMKGRKVIEDYVMTKYFMTHHGADTIDMYHALEGSLDPDICAEAPNGMHWDDWLLELND